MKKLIPAVGLCRMSTKKQDQSIIIQKQEILKYAAARGYMIIRWYEDPAQSGDNAARKAFNEMLADARRLGDFQVILLSDQDRLSRFTPKKLFGYFDQFEELGLTVESVNQGVIECDSIAGGIQTFVRAHGDHAYLKKNATRTTQGIVNAVRNGVICQKRYYGVDWAPRATEKEPRRFQVVPAQAAVVRDIYNRALAGESVSSIQSGLNRRQVATPRNSRFWTARQVRNMLRNPAYMGTNVWGRGPRGKRIRVIGGELVGMPTPGEKLQKQSQSDAIVLGGLFPAIVSREVFEVVQAMLDETDRPRVGRRHTYPLSGLLRCGCCGGPCIGKKCSFSTGRASIYYYRCGNYSNARDGQQTLCCFSVRREVLDNAVRDAIAEFLTDEEIASKTDVVYQYLRERREAHTGHRAMLAANLARLDGQIAGLEERTKTFPPDMLGPIFEEIRTLRPQRDSLQLELATEVQVGAATEEAIVATAKQITKRLKDARSMSFDLDAEINKRAFAELIGSIELHLEPDTSGSLRKARVSRLTIRYRPELLCPSQSFPKLLPNWQETLAETCVPDLSMLEGKRELGKASMADKLVMEVSL